MPSQATYFKVGLFTLAALAVFSAAVLFFGLSQAFQPLLPCETFFNHSVQGLRNGATVQFRGFTVGSVTSISMARIPGHDGGRQLVKVAFDLNPALVNAEGDPDPDKAKAFLESEVKRGLRIYLSLQGVSGITYLDLDYTDLPEARAGGYPGAHRAAQEEEGEEMPIPPIPGETALVIPSVPSTILEIGESMTQIVRAFREIDFKSLVDRSTRLVGNLEEISSQLNRGSGGFSDSLIAALEETRAAAAEVTKLARDLNQGVSGLLQGGQLRELELALADTRRTLNRLDSLMKSPQATLPTTLDNLRVMSENLREFSELARRYPSQIFLGGPPPVER
jgi:paraquat-inducible protein B